MRKKKEKKMKWSMNQMKKGKKKKIMTILLKLIQVERMMMMKTKKKKMTVLSDVQFCILAINRKHNNLHHTSKHQQLQELLRLFRQNLWVVQEFLENQVDLVQTFLSLHLFHHTNKTINNNNNMLMIKFTRILHLLQED